MTQTATEDRKDTKAFAIEAARLLKDRRCEDVRLLDVRGISQVCDYILVGSGSSDRQMKSVATELKDLGQEQNHDVFRSNADEQATWIISDFVDLVVHLFEPNLREYYDLEGLWSDALEIKWRRPGDEDGSDTDDD